MKLKVAQASCLQVAPGRRAQPQVLRMLVFIIRAAWPQPRGLPSDALAEQHSGSCSWLARLLSQWVPP